MFSHEALPAQRPDIQGKRLAANQSTKARYNAP
jgi:hypothetical protein